MCLYFIILIRVKKSFKLKNNSWNCTGKIADADSLETKIKMGNANECCLINSHAKLKYQIEQAENKPLISYLLFFFFCWFQMWFVQSKSRAWKL